MNNLTDNQNDDFLFREIKKGSRTAFSVLFEKYYADIVMYCGSIIHDRTDCEDIVQDVFYKLWCRREDIEIDVSLKVYLLRAAKNGCLDCIRHNRVVSEHQETVSRGSVPEIYDTDDYILYSDLKGHLGTIMQQMDVKAAEAFRMNRFGHLKYKEIAEKLNVSERTVQVRISNALKTIRTGLAALMLDK